LPEQTFFNLPEKKRKRIINAAVDEFAGHSFNEASIAAVIEKAGIPRGSFYQYFEDLKDLYQYMLKLSMEKKLIYFETFLIKSKEFDTMKLLRKLYRAGIKFAEENPGLAEMGSNFFKEEDRFKEEMFRGLESQIKEFYRKIIVRGVKRGEIDNCVDIEVLIQMLYRFNIYLIDDYLNKHNIGFLSDFDDFFSMVDKVLYILEHGISNNKNE